MLLNLEQTTTSNLINLSNNNAYSAETPDMAACTVHI